MGTPSGIVVFFMAAAAVVVGLVIVGLGQVFEALQEIALNTRVMAHGREASASPAKSTYAGLGFIAFAMGVLGAISMVAGVLTLVILVLR